MYSYFLINQLIFIIIIIIIIVQNVSDYYKVKKGTYSISNFKPLSKYTRSYLNKCWLEDCVWISFLIRYKYQACKYDPRLKSLI